MLQDLSVLVVTYNVNSHQPREDVHELLGLNEDFYGHNALPDIYAVGFQELPLNPAALVVEEPWVAAFRTVLSKWDFVKIKEIRLQAILLVMFVKRTLITSISNIETAFTRTGLHGMWGNKGGVSVRLVVDGVSICLVNCHLAAHLPQVDQRVQDFHAILETQLFQEHWTPRIMTHDYVVWMGDLNFRIEAMSEDEVNESATFMYMNPVERQTAIEKLLANDQLTQKRIEGKVFSDFTESVPTFMPTYKFTVGTHDYDLKRKPAFTDRILFRCIEDVYDKVTLSIKQVHYKSHPQYVGSDHKPVSALFTLKTFTGETFKLLNIKQPLRVTFLPLTRFKVYQDTDVWFTISSNSWDPMTSWKLTQWDWIGVFKADFTSLQDYMTYVWVTPTPETDKPLGLKTCSSSSSDSSTISVDGGDGLLKSPWFRVTFSAQTVILPDTYRLLYISNHLGNVLGMSPPFEVTS